MAVPWTIQALRLLVVALAVSAAMPPASAQMVTTLGTAAMVATASQITLPVGSPTITQQASTIASSCGLTSTVQYTDTVASIIASYPALNVPSDLAAMNPGLNIMQPLTPGTSICVGPIAWCNTPLVNGVCPSIYAPLTDCSTATVALTTPLNEALVLAPDLCTILQDPATKATTFTMSGVTSLVMKVLPNNKAVNAVAANPGHMHLGLWLASGSNEAMIITVRPAWFSDGSPVYLFVPGDALGWLVKFPVASGSSSSWLYQLTAPLQGLLSQFLGKRKLSRKLLQGGVDPPGGGGRGAPCGSWCYGR